MDDNSIMPFGKFKGVKLANVPAPYLLWLYSNCNLADDIKQYIKENLDVLRSEKH